MRYLRPNRPRAQIVPVTNIEIRMVKTSTRPPLRVTAETRNPNDFAVRDIEVDCTIKDKAGKDLATYTSIVYGVVPAEPAHDHAKPEHWRLAGAGLRSALHQQARRRA